MALQSSAAAGGAEPLIRACKGRVADEPVRRGRSGSDPASDAADGLQPRMERRSNTHTEEERVMAKKYRSRATRANEAAAVLRNKAEELRTVVEKIEDAGTTKEVMDLLEEAMGMAALVDINEVESLSEEMGSWRDNMSGTNLESTDKYSRVEAAADTLEEVKDEIESLEIDKVTVDEGDELDEVKEEVKESIETVVDTLDEKADDLENIDFPTMFN